jgi:DNA polymerase-3 subunit beta
MLSGVRVELKNGELTLAATDRFRLAVHTLLVEGSGDAQGEWLVPAKELLALVKALPAGPVHIGTGGRDAWAVRGGAITATQRLLDSEFPRYRQLLRYEHQTVVEVDRAALVKSVAKAIAISAALNTRYLALAAVEGELTVAPHVGDAHVQGRVRGQSLEASVEGPAVVVGYTGEYLLAALKSFEGERLFFGIDTSTRPPLLADDRAGLSGTGHRHLLMPARLGVEA